MGDNFVRTPWTLAALVGDAMEVRLSNSSSKRLRESITTAVSNQVSDDVSNAVSQYFYTHSSVISINKEVGIFKSNQKD